MSNRFFLLSLGGISIVSLGALGLIVTMVNPFRATTLQLIFFYSALFFVLGSIFSAVAFFIVRHFHITIEQTQGIALREGAIVGGLVSSILFLQSYGFLTLPVILVLVVAVGLIEFYVAPVGLSRSKRATVITNQKDYENR